MVPVNLHGNEKHKITNDALMLLGLGGNTQKTTLIWKVVSIVTFALVPPPLQTAF
jgi:hypothetical protein